MRSPSCIGPSRSLLLAAAGALTLAACGDAATPEVAPLVAESLDVVLPPPVVPIPRTGTAVPALAAVDAAITRLMKERCIGGAVIGVGYQGDVVLNRGYGYKNGPPISSCAHADDPFVGGDKIQPNTPFRIGSNGKAVTAAILRIELKKKLAAVRGAPVTDADIEALPLLDNGEVELVSPAVRAAMLAGGGFTIQGCPANPWSRVTVGKLLSHTSGLPRSSEDTYEELSSIRGLTSAAKLAAQETASGAPAAAKAALKGDQGNAAYFVPQFTLEEVMVAQADICFAREPVGASSSYSNVGFSVLGYIAEHITGQSFNAKNGYPFQHSWSLLSDFTEEELGFNVGIELSHLALGKRDAAEPVYRAWSSSQDTYYPLVDDDKRPWCRLVGAHCEFEEWQDDQSHFDWNWNEQQVLFTYEGHSVMGGTGYLAAEAPKFLAFMDRFGVGGQYGKDRALFAESRMEHMGALTGTASWVAQYQSTISYRAFADRPDGKMSFQLDDSVSSSCSVPAGINVFFAMNQSGDRDCTEANDCVVCANGACDDMDSAYSLYPSVIEEALCQVDWDAVL
jgi:hypothetical protein